MSGQANWTGQEHDAPRRVPRRRHIDWFSIAMILLAIAMVAAVALWYTWHTSP